MERNASKNANVKMMDSAIRRQENAIVNQDGLVKYVRIDVLKDFSERNASKHASALMELNAITKLVHANVKLGTGATNALIVVRRTTMV